MTVRTTWTHDDPRKILLPWNPREAMTLQQATGRAGVTAATIRLWCINHGTGRHVGGKWKVSRIALEMFLDGNGPALAAYHKGDRGSPVVAAYFVRCGLPEMIERAPV